MIDRSSGWRYNRKKIIRQRLYNRAIRRFNKEYQHHIKLAYEFRWAAKWLDHNYVQKQWEETLRHTLRNDGKPRGINEKYSGCVCDYCMYKRRDGREKNPLEEYMKLELKYFKFYGLEDYDEDEDED